ncbi:hypothetical protein SAY87_007083 [Trapa incisa]|uniref:BHLH domain-containing protein n=1 Tax=Trapa incisa TaxID=236973 RepID=A0AAN7JZP7_9MYRT|nr:hypothetical protein SAY87_007083 [Trapa incisa]
MNRVVLQLQYCPPSMAGVNPNCPWDISEMRPLAPAAPHQQQPSPFMATANSSYLFSGHSYHSTACSLPLPPAWHDNQEFPESLNSLMIMDGFTGGEADKSSMNSSFQANKLENWEQQVLLNNSPNSSTDVKQEDSAGSYVYGHGNTADNYHSSTLRSANWSSAVSASSPKSCVTSMSTGVLNFSGRKNDGRHPPPDRSSECNSCATGGAPKKAKLQPSSSQSSLKVRKEKLGDRISAIHQLVSPFGKTDTASVLLEAIGYIRFLHEQIEALSLPYMGNAPGTTRNPNPAGGERNCIFPENPGQLLNLNCMKRRFGVSEQDAGEGAVRSLRSRGLCLVPVTCTLQVGSNNGADYWASAFGGGFR